MSHASVLTYSEQSISTDEALRKGNVIIRVPATSANVGVGYDVLGLALDLWATFSLSPASELSIHGCLPQFANEDNLVWTSYIKACSMLEAHPRPLHITIDSPLPCSGGLGSSSTCVVAGVVAAQLFSGRPFDRELALNMATTIEGHPDNVAPALFGGLTSSFVEAQTTHAAVMRVAENLRFVAMAPPYTINTDEARRAMPHDVPLQTAVWQMGRCVAMTNAIERGDPELLSKTCHDKLHEPLRMLLIPDYDVLRARSLEAGACAFVISGSGSTMIALCDGDGSAQKVADAVAGTVEGLWVRTLHAAGGTEINLP